MEKYSEYKDSGVQWLGEIPSHWKCIRLSRIASLKTGTTPPFYEKECENDTVNWYTPADFKEDFKLTESERKLDKASFDSSRYSYIPVNSVMLIGIGGTAGKSSLTTVPCYSNQQITAVVPQAGVNSLFLLLFFRSIRQHLLNTAHYTTLPILNNAFLSSIKCLCPPYSEQQAIVSYLEDKCAKLDQLVSNKEKEIALLTEMKQRVIADAVTKGLNPDVKFKGTGISWLPEIPEHWKSRKMKYIFNERSEKNHPDEPMLSATQTEGVIWQSKYKGRVVAVNTGFENLKLVKEGDFVIHLRSFQGGIEYAYDRGIISAAYTILEPRYSVLSSYYKYLFKSRPFIDLLKTCVTGIREGQNINYFKLKQNELPFPSENEAKFIVAYIEEKVSKIDTLCDNLKKEIESIKEYKQRLISDVVTGQIKVC